MVEEVLKILQQVVEHGYLGHCGEETQTANWSSGLFGAIWGGVDLRCRNLHGVSLKEAES
jgi:hypothetical protein